MRLIPLNVGDYYTDTGFCLFRFCDKMWLFNSATRCFSVSEREMAYTERYGAIDQVRFWRDRMAQQGFAPHPLLRSGEHNNQMYRTYWYLQSSTVFFLDEVTMVPYISGTSDIILDGRGITFIFNRVPHLIEWGNLGPNRITPYFGGSMYSQEVGTAVDRIVHYLIRQACAINPLPMRWQGTYESRPIRRTPQTQSLFHDQEVISELPSSDGLTTFVSTRTGLYQYDND